MPKDDTQIIQDIFVDIMAKENLDQIKLGWRMHQDFIKEKFDGNEAKAAIIEMLHKEAENTSMKKETSLLTHGIRHAMDLIMKL